MYVALEHRRLTKDQNHQSFNTIEGWYIFIQETHLTNSEPQYLRFKQFHKILSSTLNSKQRGISIVVNTNIPSAILNLLLIHREDLSSLLHLSSFLINKNSSSVTQLKKQLEGIIHKKTQFVIQQLKYKNFQYINKSCKYLLIYCNSKKKKQSSPPYSILQVSPPTIHWT